MPAQRSCIRRRSLSRIIGWKCSGANATRFRTRRARCGSASRLRDNAPPSPDRATVTCQPCPAPPKASRDERSQGPWPVRAAPRSAASRRSSGRSSSAPRNDNVFKNAFVVLVTFQAASRLAVDAGMIVNLIGALFILPFLLFSATAGQLADKFEKSRLIRFDQAARDRDHGARPRGLRAAEHRACCSRRSSCMGLHSTLFGPVKYAILPQHLRERRARRRQRPGRDGHVRRDPARHDRRRACRRDQAGRRVARGRRSRSRSPSPAGSRAGASR